MVNKSPYHAAGVNVSRNAFFSSRSEKKKIFFGVYIVVKNKSKCGFSWYVLHCALLRTSFASSARSHERVHVQNVRDFPQTKLDNGINYPFLLNEHGDPDFFSRYLLRTV